MTRLIVGVVLALIVSSTARAQSESEPWNDEVAIYNMTDKFTGSLGLMVPVLLDKRTVVMFFAHIKIEDAAPATPLDRGLQLMAFVLDNREACRSEILIDEKHWGRVLDETLTVYKQYRLATSTIIGEPIIKRLVKARDVELRVCDREYILDYETIGVLNNFASQVLKRKPAPKGKPRTRGAVH